MPALSNSTEALLAALVLCMAGSPAFADFRVVKVEPGLADKALALNGQIELGLTPKVEEALAKGIAMDIVIDFRLYRERAWLWNEQIAAWGLRRQIRYQALTGQYLVTESQRCPNVAEPCLESAAAGGALGQGEGLASLAETLRQVGNLGDLRLVLPSALANDGDYALELRASLDIEALPAPLRPVAYTSGAWHLNSGWTTWTLKR
jgi:hypothetical protein